MMEALPTVVLYTVRRFELWIARPFIKAKYISLVNLLADAEVMPEYLTAEDVSGELVRWALTWLDDPAARRRAATALAELRDRVARPGASERAADLIVAALTPPRSSIPAPHGRPASLAFPPGR
jgi:lipid-A-disaccharide synthase